MSRGAFTKSQALLFTCMLLAAAPVFARKSTDVIVMKNGDRMTGQVKSLNAGILSVSLDYVNGTISVDWSEVAHLESSQLFVVLTQGGSAYEGTLVTAETPSGQPVKIQLTETSGNKMEIDRSQIVRMTQTSEEFHQRFNGAINSGILYSKGNQSTQYNLGVDVQYLRERWAAEADYTSSLSANSNSAISTRNQLQLQSYHLLPWRSFFTGVWVISCKARCRESRFKPPLAAALDIFSKIPTVLTSQCSAGWAGKAPITNHPATRKAHKTLRPL